MHKESHQNMDPVTMFTPITKWTWSIRDADGIPEIVRRATKIALEEKKGATHLELPVDVAKMKSTLKPLNKRKRNSSDLSSLNLTEAAKMIVNSYAPIVLVGNGCIRNRSSNAIRNFLDTTGIYSVNTFMGKGVISDKTSTHLGTIGIKESDYALRALRLSDLVITIGYDLVEYSPRNWNGAIPKKRIIHFDFTPAETDNYYDPDLELSGNIEVSINSLMTSLNSLNPGFNIQNSKNKETKRILKIFEKVKSEIENRIDKFKDDIEYPIKPEKLIHDVRESLSSNDIMISDVGAHKLWIAKVYRTFEPNTCIISNGFCSMGFALPGAIAAQLKFPSKKVVAMCGDGGFLMNVQELETAVRLELPIIVVVWCDSDFGVISTKQYMELGKSVFTRFQNPDFVKLAESFGAIGYRVEKTEDFKHFLQKAKTSLKTPVIIAIDIDASRNQLLFEMNDVLN
jgi:acetolactate synthase-1/2/3 large subunit